MYAFGENEVSNTKILLQMADNDSDKINEENSGYRLCVKYVLTLLAEIHSGTTAS